MILSIQRVEPGLQSRPPLLVPTADAVPLVEIRDDGIHLSWSENPAGWPAEIFRWRADDRPYDLQHIIHDRQGLVGRAEGLSYLDRIPYLEEKDMQEKGYRPSQLLNYLDFSIDLSLGDAEDPRPLMQPAPNEHVPWQRAGTQRRPASSGWAAFFLVAFALPVAVLARLSRSDAEGEAGRR